MKTIEGYDVKIFADDVDDSAIEQIEHLLAVDTFIDSKIRIMPDVHAGAGCVIGFTGDLGDKVIPNIVGVDIGCGVYVQPFKCTADIDFHKLNEYILANIPSGRNIRANKDVIVPDKYIDGYKEAKELMHSLRCYRELKENKRLYKAIGTLGGGNHFIEIDRNDAGLAYIVVHTGSRNLGKQVAQIYQKLAVKNQSGWAELMAEQNRMIAEYKAAGRKDELQEAIRNLHNSFVMRPLKIPADLCYVEGQSREDYLHDMRLCQRWAQINRRMVTGLLVDHLRQQRVITETDAELSATAFESIHNYIGEDNIIRKGAISARDGERCIIPLNMRDGSLICRGKGNADWNYSAPHGAGRLISRAEAFKRIGMEDYKLSMQGIYSESVVEETKDESPMVYKSADEIIANIKDTAAIETVIKPVFNFKAK